MLPLLKDNGPPVEHAYHNVMWTVVPRGDLWCPLICVMMGSKNQTRLKFSLPVFTLMILMYMYDTAIDFLIIKALDSCGTLSRIVTMLTMQTFIVIQVVGVDSELTAITDTRPLGLIVNNC